MQEDKPLPVDVIALRADDYSPDRKNVIISLTTKYSAAEPLAKLLGRVWITAS